MEAAHAQTTPNITPSVSAPLARGPHGSIGDVKRAHSGHFFDADTMRFFNSRIVDDWPIRGWFFRTTEKNRYDDPRGCTLRLATSSGDIEDVGEFQEFATPAGAAKVAEKFDTVMLCRVVDDLGRTFWHVILMGADTPVTMRAGSAYYDLPGALRLYDDLTGQTKRKPLHDAIAALEDARHSLSRIRDDKARAKVSRQIDALARRRDVLIGQLVKSAAVVTTTEEEN